MLACLTRRVLLRGSMNLNWNPRFEQADVTEGLPAILGDTSQIQQVVMNLLTNAAKFSPRGSTITITSLGPLGGIVTTPVINHPEVAIIGVNKLVERPVVKNGQIVVRKMMNLSSSFDHRVVDGYDAAAFIQRVKGLLEHPAALFIER